MDIWATCNTCVRTFFVPEINAGDLTSVRCPTCGALPDTFEARTGEGQFELAVVGASAEEDIPGERVVWLR